MVPTTLVDCLNAFDNIVIKNAFPAVSISLRSYAELVSGADYARVNNVHLWLLKDWEEQLWSES